MPSGKVNVEGVGSFDVSYPDGASPDQVKTYIQQQVDAYKQRVKGDLPPLLQNITQSPSQMQKTEGQPVEQRGIMSRVGEGIRTGFGDSGVTKEEAAKYPIVAGAKEALELPGRVGGAAIGAVAGGISGVAEKLGMLPANADRLMRDLGVIGMGAGIEGGMRPAGGVPEPPTPARPVTKVPEPLEQGITRRVGGDVVPREVAEEIGTAVARKNVEMKERTDALYETAQDQIPFAAKASAYEGIGTRFRGELGQDARNIVNEDTPASGRMLDYLDKGISQFKITNKLGPELSKSMREDIDAINLRGIESVRKHMLELKRGAKNDTDRRIAGLIIDRWDEHLQDIVREKLFTGDPKAVDTLLAARKSAHERLKLFGEKAELKAFKMMADGEATPEKIAGYLWGAGKIGGTDHPVKMWDQMVKLFGQDDKQIKAIRQAMWAYARERPRGAAELYNSTIGRKMFDPTTLQLIDRYSKQQNERANINDNIIAHIGAGFVGRALGHVAQKMLPVPGVGHAVSYGVRKMTQRRQPKQSYGGVQ